MNNGLRVWIIIRQYWIHDDVQGFFHLSCTGNLTVRLRQADASTDQGTVQRLSSQRQWRKGRRGEGKPWLMILS